LLATPRGAAAHVLGVSRGDYTPRGTTVHAEIALRSADALAAVQGLDADGDGVLSPREVDRAKAALKATFVEPLAIEADGARCTASFEDAALDPPVGGDGLRIVATYECPHAPSRIRLRLGFLDRMPPDHRHLATIHGVAGDVDRLASFSQTELLVDVAADRSPGFGSFVLTGVEHILTGADHLAFLLALVLGATLLVAAGGSPRRRWSSLVAMVTAFTVGHSASLAVATLWGFAPGPRLVEPAVALSVAYVGAENLFARGIRHRWKLTLPFGTVHGFALAGALLPLGVPRSQLPLALLGFNLGVEVGQLLVLAASLLLLARLRPRAWYPTGARAASAAIAVAGIAWFIQRVA
jgi:hydrogenase/urease accessory protein HupE